MYANVKNQYVYKQWQYVAAAQDNTGQ
jgi:hypothetical protein